MELTLLFTFYFTINASLFFKFFSLNLHQNHVQIFAFIFVSACYIAVEAITHRNPDSHLLKDDTSNSSKLESSAIPFLDRDRVTIVNITYCSDDRQFVSPPLLNFSEFDDDGEGETCSCDWLCGYEGDDEDDGDGDFNNKIDKFIARKKRLWREEMIRERLLCIEAAKL